MEQARDQLIIFRLGKIKNKYLIIDIVCWTNFLEICTPKFTKASRAFNRLYQEHGLAFVTNGISCWEYACLPRKPKSLIKRITDIKIISKGLNRRRFKLQLIYDSRKDGSSPLKFHEQCDGIPNTLCVMQSSARQIFGGYTKLPWRPREKGKHKADPTAFLFSLTKHSLHPIKPEQAEKAVYHEKRCFCVFGDTTATDLFIGEYWYSSKLGTSYEAPVGIEPTSYQARSYLAGQENIDIIAFQTYNILF
ncbi:hypothetical protein FGO68_gene8074 [Halteria grandinella]|uniref:TLDc domain-containing protein n=1 Tax=Halteria grandinella TaxID=5974 RepID=A0A8J8NIP3_HALGN|nr:hypothetical protein FGO68_gene8074 [Halteria grandinella]